jgi:hypothetical protein
MRPRGLNAAHRVIVDPGEFPERGGDARECVAKARSILLGDVAGSL